LIELLAAMAILGWLLASLLVVRSRYIRQAATAQRQIEAVRAAQTLLEQWYSQDLAIPDAQQGPVPASEYLSWKTSVVQENVLGVDQLQIVRLSIQDARADRPHAAARDLAKIDILVQRAVHHDRRAGGD
jgi:type II secretory pathway pseudopilin PulG